MRPRDRHLPLLALGGKRVFFHLVRRLIKIHIVVHVGGIAGVADHIRVFIDLQEVNIAVSTRALGGGGIEKAHAAAKVATPWTTKTLWVRRHFAWDDAPAKIVEAVVEMFHDEDAEVYLNGERILAVTGYTTDYVPFGIDAEAFAKAVRKGDNVLAVKIVQTVGGQFFDLGLSVEVAK